MNKLIRYQAICIIVVLIFGCNTKKKTEAVPQVSNSAYAWGGMFGTEYIIDPENDMIALFYIKMTRHEPLYPELQNKKFTICRSEKFFNFKQL